MITLPFPDKALWPNGRAHHMAKHRAFQKHKQWAYHAALAKLPRCFKWNGQPIKLHYIITPKTAHAIDKDNCIAAMKAYQDGIAMALKVDDSAFEVPAVVFALPKKPGGVEVVL